MKVSERLRALRAEISKVEATPCAECGHPFLDHALWDVDAHRCWAPRVALNKEKPCRCKRYVDPSDEPDYSYEPKPDFDSIREARSL